MSAQASPPSTPLNIVFFLIDDMGYKDLGIMGSRYYETPRIDALAQAGIIFDNAYSSAPVCTPSRGAIYTGKYPARTKYTTVYNGEAGPDDRLYDVSKFQGGQNLHLEAKHRHAMPSFETTFANAFSDSGYATGFFGKWHCGDCPGYYPNDRGFDVAAGYRLNAQGRARHWGDSHIGNVGNLPNLKPDDYLADVLTDESVKFIEDNKDEPFLLFLSHYLVHTPMEAKPEMVEKYKNKPSDDQNNPIYAAMVESVDQSVGRILDTLEEHNLTENTLVIFTSDNGGHTPDYTSNYPLMGGKSFPYEAGTKVPLILSWPEVVQAGQRVKQRTLSTDFYPTLLEAAGLPLMPQQHTDGQSLVPFLKGENEGSERELFFHFPHYTHATGPYSSLISGDWKLIRFYNDDAGGLELYGISVDPNEQNEVAANYPEIVSKMEQRIDELLKETDGEMPVPNPHFDPNAEDIRDRNATNRLARKERELFEQRIKDAAN